MNRVPGVRKRAVKLTADGLKTVRCGLVARWDREGSGRKLTHEVRADLMGVVKATANKVLGGQGVDKATLLHVFKHLGLQWEDRYCEYEVEETTAPPDLGASPVVVPARNDKRRAMVVVSGLVLASTMIAYVVKPVVERAKAWSAEDAQWTVFHSNFNSGQAEYERGDYDQARPKIERAYRMAKKLDGAKPQFYSLRMLGLLESSSDNYAAAKKYFQMALALRVGLEGSKSIPPMLLSLGEVYAKLGERVNGE